MVDWTRSLQTSILRGMFIAPLLTLLIIATANPASPPVPPVPPVPPAPPESPSHAQPAPTQLDHTASTAERVELVQDIAPSLRRHASSRYIILSDSNRTLISEVEHTLEETRRQFDRWCRGLKIPPPRPDQRMLCIVFHNRDAFSTFARSTEDNTASSEHIEGYFSPRNQWVVLFDPADAHDIAKADEQLAQARQDIQDAKDRGADPDAIADATRQLDDAAADITRAELARRSAVTIHEAVHQLVHAGDGFPGRHRWPVWLHEAVAVSFETDNRRRPFGPDRADTRRRDTFETHLETDRLLPLAQLLEVEQLDHTDTERTSVIYSQSGAFLSWLHTRRRRELSTFLQTLGVPNAQGQTPTTTELFIEVFGPIDALERRWLRDERR